MSARNTRANPNRNTDNVFLNRETRETRGLGLRVVPNVPSSRNTRSNPNRNQERITLTRSTRETRSLGLRAPPVVIQQNPIGELDNIVADDDNNNNNNEDEIAGIVNNAFPTFNEWWDSNTQRLNNLNTFPTISSVLGQNATVSKIVDLPLNTLLSLGGFNNRYFIGYYMFELIKYVQQQIALNVYNTFSFFYGLLATGFTFRLIVVIENQGEDEVNFGYNGNFTEIKNLISAEVLDGYRKYYFWLNYNILSVPENEFGGDFNVPDSRIWNAYEDYIREIFVKYQGNNQGSDPELSDFPGHRIIFKLQIMLREPLIVTQYTAQYYTRLVLNFGPLGLTYQDENTVSGRVNQALQVANPNRIPAAEEFAQRNIFFTAGRGNEVRLFTRNGFQDFPANTLSRFNRIGGKMFYKEKDLKEPTFLHKQYLQKIPFTKENFCFPMSVFCCQLRKVSGEENETIVEESNSGNNFLIRIQCHQTIQNYPFCKYLQRGDDEKIYFVFGNNDLVEWIQTSILVRVCRLFHNDVERYFARVINHRDEIEMATFYSKYIGCCIHLFCNTFDSRKKVYFPDNQTKISYHMYIYTEREHCHSVQSILPFLSSKLTQPHQLCDFCQEKMIGYKKEKCLNHIKKCIQKKNFLSPKIEQFAQELNGNKRFSIYRQDYKRPEERMFFCKLCSKEFYEEDLKKNHICSINYDLKETQIQDKNIFCLDIESCQDFINGKFQHTCVLICVKQVYGEQNRYQFKTMFEFCSFVEMNPHVFSNAIFLAHNGGGYDYHFLVVELESKNKIFTKIPRPNSEHKYLEISWYISPGISIRFIDFMMFVNGSLKNIAKSFELDVQKGDFPHRFLNSETIHYIGPLPPLTSVEDYFSFSLKKSLEEKEEVSQFYDELKLKYCSCLQCMCNRDPCCVCNKNKWNCWDFLTEYCWIDVEVLSLCIKKYRDFLLNIEREECCFWNPSPVEPFQCVTQSQLAMMIFSSGWKNSHHKKDHEIYLTKNIKTKVSWKSIHWLESLQEGYNHKIQHAGNNSERVYFPMIRFYADGYSSCHRTVFVFIHASEKQCVLTPTIIQYFEENRIRLVTQHEDVYQREVPLTESFEKYEVFSDREIFYGGRTEVFTSFLDADKTNTTIHYHDVCSLYPYVCSFKKLPHGKPTFIYGDKIEPLRLTPVSENPYFGFAKIKINCDKKDYIGLLPSRDEEGKLVFSLYDKVGFWHTEEIYLAMENGYVVEEIYQVIHFEDECTSTTLFRGYMAYFLKIKMESEGWKKLGASTEFPDESEKERIVEMNYQGNGQMARINKDKVQKNPIKRMIAKIFLNCLWGKLCQDVNTNFYCDIDNLNDFQYLFFESNLDINKMTFREYGEKYGYKVKYEMDQRCFSPNKRYNIFISASVTAHARCILHRKMLKVGPQNVLYCDTDSVIFVTPKDENPETGNCLGQWTNEYPYKVISRFYAIAPKFYSLVFENEMSIKSKGIWLTQKNKERLSEVSFKELINGIITHEDHQIQLDNMTIFPNTTDSNFPYGTVFTRYNNKKVSSIISKRSILISRINGVMEGYDMENLERIDFFPFGYEI